MTIDENPEVVGLLYGEAKTDAPPQIIGGVTLEEIRDAAVPAGTACGIYFLLLDGEIVYVGQSLNIHSRMGNHLSTTNFKPFDSAAWIPVDPAELKWVEAFYIAKFRPLYNFNPGGVKS